MGGLREAILKSQQQRAAAGTPCAPSAPAHPPAAPDLPLAAPGTTGRAQQLASLRRRFEAQAQRPAARFDEGPNHWLQGHGTLKRGPKHVAPARCSQVAEELVPGDLESDILSVLSEAGVTGKASAAVLEAVQRGGLTANPGVLLCQLLRYQSCLDGTCLTQRQAMSLLASYPVLLNTSADTLSWHMEELTDMFGKQTASMVIKRPGLLCASPFTVWSNLEALAGLLGTTAERARQLVARQPRLLLNSTSALSSRMKDLEDVTGLAPVAVQALVRSQPALLTYHAATLAQNVDHLTTTLNLPHDKVGKILSKAPAVLMLSPETLTTKLAALAGVLQCSMEHLTPLVCRQPSLLAISTAHIMTKCRHLASALNATEDSVRHLVMSNPALLTLAPDTLHYKLTNLRQTLDQAASLAQQALATRQHADVAVQQVSTTGQHESPAEGQALQQEGAEHAEGSEDSRDGVSSGVPEGDLVLQAAVDLANSWQEQLGSASSSVQAAYGCFSVQRYHRLIAVIQTVVQRAKQQAQSGSGILDVTEGCIDQGAHALELGSVLRSRHLSLSQVLRAKEAEFAEMLQELRHCTATGPA